MKSPLVSLEFCGSFLWKTYWVKKLLAFILLIQRMNHFLFIHPVTYSLAQSFRRSFGALKFEVNAIYIKQFCLCTAHILEFAFKMIMQLILG